MLKTEHLSVSFDGKSILEDISVSFAPGEIAAVLGLNGAGKTTLLKCILGFYRPAYGEVTENGINILKLSEAERARKFAYVPQKYDGGFRYSTEEFVSMGVTAYLGIFSHPGEKELKKAEEILDSLGCSSLIHRSMSRLSGGETRMVYLARSVMQDARYLILDEPVASLDFSRQHIFLDHLKQYVREHKTGVVMTIHDPPLAFSCAEHMIFLNERKVLLDMKADSPEYREKLAECITRIYGPKAKTDFDRYGMNLRWD